MVRNYVRKTPGPAYSKEDVQKAKEMIESGRGSLHEAAKSFHIPKSTLSQWITGSRGVKSATMGRPTAIPAAEEKFIADCLKTMSEWGIGLSKKEILSFVGEYVTRNNIPTPFKNGIPGDDFYNRFMKMHNLSLKNPQAVEVSSTPCSSSGTSTPSSTYCFFEEFLLEQMKQQPLPQITCKKVCSGAEVLTSDEVVQRLQKLETDNQKTPKVPPKNSSKKRKTVGEGIDSDAVDPNPILPINQRSEKKTSKLPPNRPSKKRKTVCESGDDDSSCSNLDEANKLESILQKEASDSNSETSSELERKQICPLEVNDFVIIGLEGKKDRKVGYVAQVQEMKEAITVSYLQRNQKTSNAFIFPKVPDISTVHRSDIVYNLKKPVQPGTIKEVTVFDKI
ncbi:hypothetical protein V9T40_003233 [Parthenolecanium corni]|uniref:HTH psq-type domain-containing protein n=1 Tax=Parthenolecanium corni TaxID=536013 RepID=A0AAN9TQ75_9HEMI